MNAPEFKAVSANAIDWEKQVEHLAELGVPFKMAGFSYPHHVTFFDELCLEYDLESWLATEEQCAYFQKKTDAQ